MSQGDIAVIGMAGRFPGAPTIEQFWKNVQGGVESIERLSDEELLKAGVSPAELSSPDYVKASPILDGVDQFDASFFGFSPRDASVMDPAHRIFLEVAWEAMEHAGHTGLPDEAVVGVFAGSGAPYYLMDHVRRNRELMRSMGEFLVRHTNNDMNFLTTRVSYEMDLHGPSVNVQTACSSALVSVHMACESIRRGECTMAIAGGSTVLIPDKQGYVYQEGEIMSPDGHCRPFDEKSAGTVFGSGSGAVVLKGLEQALDDGDTIHAIIKGSAINNDGAVRVGFLAPGVDGQAKVVGRALDAADVSADSITYIEAHGTGTLVGDPIEVTGLTQAFRGRTTRKQFCAIGSVKSNIGHLGEAAGVASFIKAVMALKHRQIPPSLGYERPNPQIDFEDSPFFVNSTLREWKADGPLRCGITALGAGGTNCHVILEEAPEALPGEGERAAQLFVLSAKSEDALERARENLADVLEDDASVDFADAAYTLAVGRRSLTHRTAVVGRDRASVTNALRGDKGRSLAALATKDVVFTFPGGGAQYARMGEELYNAEKVYREAVDECLEIANARLGRDLGALMFGEGTDTRTLEQPSLSLPSLFTTEYALAKLFQSWGVEPTAFVGHSMGEYVAACLSGVMTVREGLELVMLRGRLFEKIERGRMLSVSLSESALRAMLPQGLDVAAVNAPELCVASGPAALIDALEKTLNDKGIENTRVRIDVAAHSSMLDPVLDEFRRFCKTVAWQTPQIPFTSNVSGNWITAAEATDPEYWVRHLRSTVRFSDCLAWIRASGEKVLLEAGPGRTLTMLARAQATPAAYAFNSMRHPDEVASDVEYSLNTLGKLWVAGADVEWGALYDGQLRNRIPLPTYPWDHRRHWIDAPVGAELVEVGPSDARRPSVSDWFERPVWTQTLPAPTIAPCEGRALVFADAVGFGDAVAAQLEKAGRTVSRVTIGDAFKQDGARFTVRASTLADHERLVKTLVAAGGLPDHVVHAWSLSDATMSLDDAKEVGFHSVLTFAQALSSEDPDARFTLDVLTNNTQRVAGEWLEPVKSLVFGPARVMPREFPNVRARMIDVALLPSPRRETLAARIANEIASEPADETIAYRGLDRFVQTREPTNLEPVSNRLRDGGAYVITGGLGGIGYAVAEHLAKKHRAKLVLLGRGATKARAGAKINALLDAGAEVEVIQADVTNATQMKSAFAKARDRFGAINGVFHAAGTLGDSLMPLKTREDAERVLAPKVQGTLALDAAIGDAPLDLFVLFSSVSSIAGLAGQADYTAANAFMDAFAQERSARDGQFTVAVNWSGWRDVGMAANIASGAGAGGGVGEDVHPVVGKRIWSSAEAELFSSELSVNTHWVLGEHRLRGGRSLMPGTGFVEIARAALEARSEPRTLEIRDLAFMSPFVVQDDAPREMRVHLARNGAVVIAGRAHADDGSPSWQEHATGTVAYVDTAAPSALDVAGIAARCTVREETFARDQQSVNMDFGTRWKNLKSIKYGKGEALVTLELPREFAGDLDTYRLHPALLDMATGRCEALVPGFDAQNDFYVPLSYTKLRLFDGLTPRLYSHVRLASTELETSDIIVFDVTITDETGRVLADIEEFVMTRVADKNQLQGDAARAPSRRSHANFDPPAAPAAPPPFVAGLDEAITAAEGMEAIERIASGPAIAQIFATPKPVRVLLTELRRPQTFAAPARVVDTFVPTAPVAEIEAVLAAHEVVREAVVMERRSRPGETALVGYVVFETGEQATPSDLRRFLKQRMPEHIVRTFIELEAMPRTPDGAVDRGALPDPFAVVDNYVAPRSDTEKTISEIWKEVLGVQRVSVYDNFFDAGGHSLLAVRVVVKIDKALGVRLNQTAMVLQTLEQISSEVDRRRAAPAPSTPAEQAPAEKQGLGKRLFGAFKRD
jgi:acyl transferase domain-containing protein/acyl carrier protein